MVAKTKLSRLSGATHLETRLAALHANPALQGGTGERRQAAPLHLLFIQLFDLPLEPRIPRNDRREISDVDDPGEGVGDKQVWVSAHLHLTLPRGSNSDSRAWASSTSRCRLSNR